MGRNSQTQVLSGVSPTPSTAASQSVCSSHLVNELLLVQQVDLRHIVLLLQSEGKVCNAPEGQLLLQGEDNVLGREGIQMVRQSPAAAADHY